MSKPVILCVDDERMILTSLKSQLQNSLESCYQIELAESGEEALELIEELCDNQTEVPLVIADQIMGGMYGDELLVKIKKRLPKTLSIMLTGQASAESVGEAVNKASLFRYISKPWDEDDFILTVKTALQSYRHQKKLIRQDGYQNALNKILQLVLKPRPFNDQLGDVLEIILNAPCFSELKKGSIFIESLGHVGSGQVELVMIAEQNQGYGAENSPFNSTWNEFKNMEPRIQLICGTKENCYYQVPIVIFESAAFENTPHASALSESTLSESIVGGVLYLYVDPSHCEPPQTQAFISSVCHIIAGMIRLSQYNLAIEHHSFKLEEQVEKRTEELNQALKVQAQHNNILLKTNQELEYYATTDELTGLLNRRCFFERADQEAYRSQRYERKMVLAMLDLDYFKAVNDQYGHQAGDTVLNEIAKVISDNVREHDVIGRVGGEEFAIVMPETDLMGGKELCERIRLAIVDTLVQVGPHSISVSTSIGITTLRAKETSICAAMSRADQALYGSKDKGRNLISLDYEI